MRITYVVPRYGAAVIGGAELAARMLAERLVTSGVAEVEILTTCALDPSSWVDHYPAGTTVEEGVTVRRFGVDRPRDPAFASLCDELLADPAMVNAVDGRRFIDAQGPVSSGLLEAVADGDADVVAFYPYLFHPTVAGIGSVPGPAILHPAAHDEPPMRLGVFQSVFAAADGLVFHTASERRLVYSVFPGTLTTPQVQLGLGVERCAPDHGALDRLAGEIFTDGVPFVLCLGRVDRGKGCELLARFFAAHRRTSATPLRLVYAGPVVDRPAAHPDIVVVGPVTDGVKWALLERAAALVSPSAYESFSLVVIEAWTAGTPVLVNGACGPTREHVEAALGGWCFESFTEFTTALDVLLADPVSAASMAAAGQRYAAEVFSWPVILERYMRFCERVADR